MHLLERVLEKKQRQLDLIKKDLCKGEFTKVDGQLIRKDGCPTCSNRELCRSRRLTEMVFK